MVVDKGLEGLSFVALNIMENRHPDIMGGGRKAASWGNCDREKKGTHTRSMFCASRYK
jgi:hypothetical protein